MTQLPEAITAEVATVYRYGGRRYLTVKTARRKQARREVLALCDCHDAEKNRHSVGAYICELHQNVESVPARVEARYREIVRAASATPATEGRDDA